MAEYIEREALLGRLNYNGAMNMPPLEYCREVVAKFPAADVVEVRQCKAEAVKAFAEEVKAVFFEGDTATQQAIDNLVKEMDLCTI